MRPVVAQSRIPQMAADPLRITLELERGRDPISGRLSVGGGGSEFRGWMELLSALESAFEGERDGAHEAQQAPGSERSAG